MNIIKYTTIVLLQFAAIISCNEKKSENASSIETIVIDQKEQNYAYASFVDSTEFEFVPLETNDSSLIAEVTRIYMRDNKFIVCDNKQAAAVIFNRDGSFHTKICRIGRGPEEYPFDAVNDIVVTKNYVAIYAPFIQKILFYNFNGEYVKEISTKGTWGTTLFTFDEDQFYLVDTWGHSELGNYHLYQLGSDGEARGLFPYSSPKIKRGWGMTYEYSIFDDRALVLISSIDTIYSVSEKGGIAPRYSIDNRIRNLPKEMKEGNGRNAFMYAMNNNYIRGVDKLIETARYLFLVFDSDPIAIYDKQNKEVIAFTNLFMHPSYYVDIGLNKGNTIQDNKIITILEPSRFAQANLFDTTKCRDKEFTRKYYEILGSSLNETDNPVLLLFTLKE